MSSRVTNTKHSASTVACSDEQGKPPHHVYDGVELAVLAAGLGVLHAVVLRVP